MGYESIFETDWYVSIEEVDVMGQKFKAKYLKILDL